MVVLYYSRMFPRDGKSCIPSTSNSVQGDTVLPPVEMSSDEDDEIMGDLAAGGCNQLTDDEDAIELSSDDSSEVYPKPEAKISKMNVINALFPKSKVHNVWISSKTVPAGNDVSHCANPKKTEDVNTSPAPRSVIEPLPQHKLAIGGVEVQFPVKPYSCQIALMFKVITGISKKQNCLLESPTGSGKTLALLCAALAWQQKEKARVADVVAKDYFKELDLTEEDGGEAAGRDGAGESLQAPSSTSGQPFARTLFGERSIYDSVKSDNADEDCCGRFKRPEPLRENDSTCGTPGLVKLHKRQKLSGEGDSSASLTPEESAAVRRTPEENAGGQSTPEKNIGWPRTPEKNGSVQGTSEKNFGWQTTPDQNIGWRRTPEKHVGWQSTPEKNADLQRTPENISGVQGTPEKFGEGQKTPEKSTASGIDQQESPKDMSVPKIYYGARTHKQIAQVVKEFRRTAYVGRARMSILSSREYSCVRELDRGVHRNKNDMCRDCISSKPKKKKGSEEDTSCVFYNNRHKLCGSMPPAWDLEELVERGRERRSCPYYAARLMAEGADIVFCPYNYLIDPAIRDNMSIDMTNDIVILDEAHNIEDVCREAASLTLTRRDVITALDELESQGRYLTESVAKAVDVLVRALKNWDHWFQNQTPLLKDVPTNSGESVHTWQGGHFLATLDCHNLGGREFRAFVGAARLLGNLMRDSSSAVKLYGITGATIALCDTLATSLGYMFRNERAGVEDFKATLVRTVALGNDEPLPDSLGWRSTQHRKKSVETLSLRLLCMNPAVVFAGLEEAGCIVLSSGTLTPIVSLHSELGSRFPLVLSTAHVIPPDRVWVGSLLTGAEGVELECTARGTDRPMTQDGIGRALLWVCEVTPHGVLCFMPSYTLMNKLVKRWQETDIWQKLTRKKHVFMESRNVRDHAEIMDEFYSVVGTERGALLLAVYRGKVSEGMDFKDEQARAVVTVGIPFPNTFESMVSNKMKYNDAHSSRQLLPGREWLRVQAFRALNQAVGRCVRHRGDWGAVLLIDSRFNQPYYTEHLSKWVRNFLGDNHHTWRTLVNNPDSLESFMQNMTIRQNEEQD